MADKEPATNGPKKAEKVLPSATSTPFGSGVTIKFTSSIPLTVDGFTFEPGKLYDVCMASAERWVRRNSAVITDDSTDS